MVAGIDIGNSTLGVSIFDTATVDHELIFQSWPHPHWKPHLMNFLLEHHPRNAIISSVAGGWLDELLPILHSLDISWTLVSKHTPSPVDFSRYESELGPDRVCTTVGAHAHYPTPLCVVDMGTATTLSLLDSSAIYQGGLIMPGVGTMFKSLSLSTELLPEMNINQAPHNLLGLNTQENIRNGVYHLTNFGLSGILARLRNAHPDLTIIGTGGWSSFFSDLYDFVDNKLIFKGLKIIFESTLDSNP